MGAVQKVITSLVPGRLARRWRPIADWVMRCPCGRETSVWEMGGIRYKAAGRPGAVAGCGNRFWGQLDQRKPAAPAEGDRDGL